MTSLIIIKIFILTTISSLFALTLAPIVTHFLYNYKLGKRIRQSKTPLYYKLHQHKTGTPCMGGIIIWGTTLILAVLFAFLPKLTGWQFFDWFNFLNRQETLLPLGALVAAALVGLVDDFLSIVGQRKNRQGIKFRYKFLFYMMIALWGALWFYFKLDWDVIHVPFYQDVSLGWWFIPFFIFVTVGTSFAVNETDGLDGLAGGVLLVGFATLAAIAFASGKYDLAALCAVIVGALVSFLWFNVPPARFFMGDTGSMALGTAMAIIAFYLKASLLLPIIGLVLVVEAGSVLIQLAARKFWRRKVFLSSPLHHHLEAIGWSEPKIVMRLWMISIISSLVGLILFLSDRTI